MTDVAVITGGASGFGRALAEGCAARGMNVVVLDLDGDRADTEAAALAAAYGVEAFGLRVDVADGASVQAAAATVGGRFGRAYLVVSNVGVQLFASIDRATDDEWRWLLDVNVVGSARVARAFLPLLRRAERGRLAFTSSSSVLDPASRMSMYQASKFAVWGLAETLRVELAPEGIGVSVIFPSGMLSRHLETSEAAQPAHLRRPIAGDDDIRGPPREQPDDGEVPRHARGGRRRSRRCHLGRSPLRRDPRRVPRGARRHASASCAPLPPKQQGEADEGARDRRVRRRQGRVRDRAIGRLAEVVASGAASRATLDVRLPDSELEALGPQLMTKQEERAVIALWDTDAGTALCRCPSLPVAGWSARTTSRKSCRRTTTARGRRGPSHRDSR